VGDPAAAPVVEAPVGQIRVPIGLQKALNTK